MADSSELAAMQSAVTITMVTGIDRPGRRSRPQWVISRAFSAFELWNAIPERDSGAGSNRLRLLNDFHHMEMRRIPFWAPVWSVAGSHFLARGEFHPGAVQSGGPDSWSGLLIAG